jgi:hypothetical protein
MKIGLVAAMPVLALLFFHAALAANLHENREIHENLIAAQELIALGCIGKLGIVPNISGSYSPATLAKVQECADTEGTDIAAKIMSYQERGEVEKARMPTYLLHYSVLFAKRYSTQAQAVGTTDLINAARKRGAEHYPYTPKSANK